MKITQTVCPSCALPLEVPKSFETVICAVCGTTFQVRRYKDAINLSVADSRLIELPSPAPKGGSDDGRQAWEAKLEELDETIAQVSEEIEVIRSREQAVPLQLGCALFGTFAFVIVIITLFMPLGREYFGGWFFYLTLAAAVLWSVTRIRRNLERREEIARLNEERQRLEAALTYLESEKAHLLQMADDRFGGYKFRLEDEES